MILNIIYSLQLLMKYKQYEFVQRKNYCENKPNIFIERNSSNSKDKYRNSIATDSRFYQPQTHRLSNQKRFSMNINSRSPNLKGEDHNKSYHTMQNIKNTLSLLQSRINNAKEHLNATRILGKSIIYEQSEDSKLNQSNSIASSLNLGQKQEENKLLFNHKKSYFNQLIEIAQLTKIKSYYKSELAKIIISNNQKLSKYFCQFWKNIKNLSNVLEQQTTANLIKRLDMNKKLLVIGLDGTIIYCAKKREELEEIDIIIQNSEESGNKEAYVSIRPHAISFLKKMSKKFQIIIFSTRTKKQTDSILDQIDPMSQFIHHRLYKRNCHHLQSSILIKDLRLLSPNLSQTILLDSNACIYQTQLSNFLPILPYIGGSDSQLYCLQKYLDELNKVKDIRVYNTNYFQLQRYADFDDANEALKNIYFTRH